MREQWFAGNGFLGEYVFSVFHDTVGDAHTHLKDFGLRGALPNVSDELRLRACSVARVAENPNDPYRYDTRDHIISYHIDRFFLIRYQISE